jgi:anti-sigma factor RsiW
MTASESLRPAAICPQDEILVAYLARTLSTPERFTVDDHLQACDRCLHTIAVVDRRLRLAAEIPLPVPHSVVERVRALRSPAPDTAPSHAPRRQPFGAWLADAVTRLVRLPVLIPTAVAVGVLAMVIGQHAWLSPTGPRDLTRSVPVPQQLRTRAAQTLVRAAPTSNANVVTTLPPNTLVSIEAQEREWYRITLPDGTRGWLDRNAFD